LGIAILVLFQHMIECGAAASPIDSDLTTNNGVVSDNPRSIVGAAKFTHQPFKIRICRRICPKGSLFSVMSIGLSRVNSHRKARVPRFPFQSCRRRNMFCAVD
jgi:hypothetical protein